MNLLYLLNSPDKKAEAEALAAAVTAGIIPAQMAVSFLILTLWAFGEAVLDVKTLLAGGRVSFWKTDATWKTGLSGLLDQSFLGETAERTGREKLYGIFELHDVLYGPRGTKFPHDGSHPVEYPDGTG